MVALNFPNSPAIGDTWPVPPQAGLPTYQWDGTGWVSNFALGFAYVPLDGSQAMTGLLTLSGPPTAPLHASTKGYVDAAITGGAVRYDVVQTLTDAQQLQARQNINALMRSYLAGLGLSTPGSSASFTVAVGMAMDGANVAMLVLAAALTKTTAAWALGAGGALDTGAIANSTWYHVYLMRRPDTGAVDVALSLSASAPTTGGAIPAAYTQFRRIGSLLTTASGQWTPFVQLGDEFLWATMAQDVIVTTLSTTATLYPLTVPPGVQVTALMRGMIQNATTNCYVMVTSPDETSVASGGAFATANVSFANEIRTYVTSIRTDINRQVRAISSLASTTFRINTYGYIDRRGRDA